MVVVVDLCVMFFVVLIFFWKYIVVVVLVYILTFILMGGAAGVCVCVWILSTFSSSHHPTFLFEQRNSICCVNIIKGSHASMWRKQLKQIEHLCSNQNDEAFVKRVLNHALEQLVWNIDEI